MNNKFKADTRVIEVVNEGKAIGTIRRTKHTFFAYYGGKETEFMSEKDARKYIIEEDAKHTILSKFDNASDDNCSGIHNI